eukprot:TRINITY_DN3348_c0_g1_i5.p1 TRINITY_DN3348_c0_g1~~TRINITY_DN3348_c0_g1_i5.p1  ORF type:complete len:169 (+),score=28.09 TRINITY_DN3348_c0_g1_i5:247-753(+)
MTLNSHSQESSFQHPSLKFSPLKEEEQGENVLLSKIEEESKSEVQNSIRSSRKAATKVNSPKGLEEALKGDLSILPFSKIGGNKKESVVAIEELKITPNATETSAMEKYKELFIEVLLQSQSNRSRADPRELRGKSSRSPTKACQAVCEVLKTESRTSAVSALPSPWR